MVLNYQPESRDFERPDMALVPEGEFLFGGAYGLFHERFSLFAKAILIDMNFHEDMVVAPEWICLEQFAIGTCEVTNGEYLAFVDSGDYRVPAYWEPFAYEVKMKQGFPPPISLDVSAIERQERLWSVRPVYGASYDDCLAYCSWLSAKTGVVYRLPTEQEWEKAVCWNPTLCTKTLFSWGDAYLGVFLLSRPLCNWWMIEQTTPVGLFDGSDGRPDGRSYYGCCDMIGNVLEWTSTPYTQATTPSEWLGAESPESLRLATIATESREYVLRGGGQWNEEYSMPNAWSRRSGLAEGQVLESEVTPGFRLCTNDVVRIRTSAR